MMIGICEFCRIANVLRRACSCARIVLLAAAGMSDTDIAAKLLTDRRVAARWRARFLASGVEGLMQDATRPGRPRTARAPAQVEEVVRITLEETPPGATHWSTRTLAEHLGTNATAVTRIWRAHGLKPHRVESFKISNDPHFIEKLDDIVGLYLDPPEHALGLLGPDAPVRHAAKRRRIKTVMQELIYRACRLIEHGRRIILGLGANDRSARAFQRLHGELFAACG
jgi:transposase